jgi:hypothetical protein
MAAEDDLAAYQESEENSSFHVFPFFDDLPSGRSRLPFLAWQYNFEGEKIWDIGYGNCS